MNMQELPYWGQLLVIAAVCIGMGYVFYQFMYTPEVEAVDGLERTLNSLREEINRYKPFESRKDALQQEIIQIREDLNQLESVFPSEKDDVEVKRFVETIANEFDVEMNRYQAAAVREDENYLERVVNYSSRGRVIDYMKFFDALASRGQVIHIYDLNMKNSTARDSSTARFPVEATFTISSYVYRPVPQTSLEE